MASYKKLYRSTDQKVIAGVAGGIAQYTGIHPLVVRLLFIALVIAGGSGVLLYSLLWFAVPKSPDITLRFDDGEPGEDHPAGRFMAFLKATAAALLFATLVSWYTDGSFFMPFAVSIAIGFYYFSRSTESEGIGERLGLYRSANDKKIFGVFGGLADRYAIDATVLRVIGVVVLVVGGGILVPVYCLYALLVPVAETEEDLERIVIV